jgi:peptidoglycan/LPS O-acetylase OafA/YrhL
MQKPFHLTGLNGLRAMASLAVVVSHTLLAGPSIGLPAREKGLDLAGFGVTIFFALSGFLITYLLLLEKRKFDTINIKAFYIRRFFRILPLYYFYLLLAVIAISCFQLIELPGTLGFYVFLSANVPFILGVALPVVGHYWSLGVEEQFYLFWPWVVAKTNKLTRVLIISITVFILVKLALNILYRYTGVLWPYSILSVSRFDCMAIGALGAKLAFENNRIFKGIVFNPVVEMLAWGVIVLVFFNSFHVISSIDNDIIAVVSVVLIMNVSLNNRKIIGLDKPVLNFLGKISYGIYVYHPLVILFGTKMVNNADYSLTNGQKLFAILSFVLFFTITIAWLSYEFFEKRFLRRKDRFAVISSSSMQLNMQG